LRAWRTSLIVVAAALALACSGPPASSARAASASEFAPPGLDPGVLAAARTAAACAGADEGGSARGSSIVAVIDYSLPSTAERLWVLDLAAERVLFRERVAHGKGTGGDRAVDFSDVEGSKQSSIGLFRTAETYTGKHGYSLRLDGLEPGWNGNARERAIVIHGADYADEAFVRRHGRLGRSWGCPAVRPAVSTSLIDTIKEGALVFAWYPDEAWMAGSRFLHCDAAP